MAAFMWFDTVSMMFLAGGTSLVIATVVGHLVTTWMTGRIARMNTAAIFVSLLFLSWLWGEWSMPLVVIVKVVAQNVDQFFPSPSCWGTRTA